MPPADRPLWPPTPRVVLLVVAGVFVSVLLLLAGPAIAPFIVGLLLFYLLNPPVNWLSRAGVPRGAAILLVYAVVVIVVWTLLRLTLAPLLAQIQAFASHLPDAISRARTTLMDFYRNVSIAPDVRAAIDQAIGQASSLLAGLSPGTVVPVVSSLAGIVLSALGYVILPAWLFYLLKDQPRLSAQFDEILPGHWRDDVWAIVRIIDRVVGQWIRGQLLLGFTVGVASYVGLVVLARTVDPIFGDFAVLLAVVSGLLELVPIIGPIIATVPAVLVGIGAGTEGIVAVLVLYFGIQQLENNLLVPKIQSDAVKLHPSAVMFFLVVGGALGGLIGAILSLPVAAMLRDLTRYLFHRLADPPVPADVALVRVLGERQGRRQRRAAAAAAEAGSSAPARRGESAARRDASRTAE